MSDEQRGPKGDKGDQGDPGKRGEPLNRAARRSLIFLFVLAMLIGAANLLWTSHVVQADNQQKCASVEQLAHIPIPQPVAGNPSREFAAALENVYRARAAQLGCTGGKR